MPAPGPRPAESRASVAAAAGLALVVSLLFGGAFEGRTIGNWDIQQMFLPQVDMLVYCVSHGAWPVWDPLLGFGQPLLANPGNQVLYPPTWLNLLVLPETYVNLYVMGHALWGGLGVYLLARRALRLSGLPAWLAGAGWMASGPVLSHVQRWQHFASAAWLPWVLLAGLRGTQTSTRGRALVLAGVLSLQWLAGSVEIAGVTLLLALAWTVAAGWRSPGLRACLRAWAAALALAVALTAALWLPALDLLRNSSRADLARAGQLLWSIHPWRWIETLAPLRPDEVPLRPEWRRELFGPALTTIAPSLYLGATLAGLVLLAVLRSDRRRLVWGLVLVGCGAAVLSTGAHVGPLASLAERLPLASIVRFPGKLTLLVAFAWSLLAGLGLETLRSGRTAAVGRLGASWPFAAAAAPALALSLVPVAAPGLLTRTILRPPPPGASVWDAVGLDASLCGGAAALGALAAVLAWASLRRPGWRPACLAGLATCAVLDLLLPNHRVNPMVPARFVGQAPETAERLRRLHAERIQVLETALPGDAAGTDPWELDPRNSLPVPAAVALGANLTLSGRTASRWGFAGSYGSDALVAPTRPQFLLSRLFAVVPPPAMVRLLQAGGVSHVVARAADWPGLSWLGTVPSPLRAPIGVFGVPGPLPRSFVAGEAIEAAEPQAAAALVDARFDLRQVVLLQDAALGHGVAGPATGESHTLSLAPDRLEIAAESSGPAYLVVLEGYDPGWRAWVDGRPAAVLRANLGFRAVGLPAGKHVVRMRYQPPAVLLGALLSAVALAGALVVAARTRVRPG